MIIGIIGNGFVGKATKILSNPEITNLCYDINPDLCDPKGLTLADMRRCDLIFISVPTPMNKDGSVYLNIVKSVVQQLEDLNVSGHIVIRSTVPPGTSDSLGTYFMPEFLTEKNFVHDFKTNPLWIFGLRGATTDEEFKVKISNLFTLARKHECISSDKMVFVKNKEAEMIKYFRNTFLSVKVSYCNELEEYCRIKGIDYETVRKHAAVDPRIGVSHTTVPGHDGKRGFGGTCFPKDTSGLLSDMKSNGMTSYILESAVKRNCEVDRAEQDWLKDKGRAAV